MRKIEPGCLCIIKYMPQYPEIVGRTVEIRDTLYGYEYKCWSFTFPMFLPDGGHLIGAAEINLMRIDDYQEEKEREKECEHS